MLSVSKTKIAITVICCLAGVLCAIPNLFSKEQLSTWPRFLPTKQMVFGLDLSGGAHLVLSVDTKSVIREHLQVMQDETRRLLRSANVGYSGGLSIVADSIKTTIRKPEQAHKAIDVLRPLTYSTKTGLFGANKHATIKISEDGVMLISLTKRAAETLARQAIDQSIEVLRSRIDAIGTTEPLIVRQGENRILVEVPGHSDTTQLKELLRRTAKMTFHLVEAVGSQALSSKPSRDTQLFYTRKIEGDEDSGYPVLVKRTPVLIGSSLISARVQFDDVTKEPVVAFRFNSQGTRKFAEITRQNVGKMLAVVLDDNVITYPRINSAIPGGSGVISGKFTTQSASNLSLLLRTGALPTTLTIIKERVVGPSLGADSIRAGKIATLVGTIGVAVCMALSYGLLGLFANLAVLLNMVFTIAVLSILGSTLTLPGIAGIVLGVGMAVDANVLIYERIREEQMLGHKPAAAITEGFKKVLATILDANSTHVIAALVLFYFGTGPIKGFALTVTISTVISYLTSVSITHLLIVQWLRWSNPTKIPL